MNELEGIERLITFLEEARANEQFRPDARMANKLAISLKSLIKRIEILENKIQNIIDCQ